MDISVNKALETINSGQKVSDKLLFSAYHILSLDQIIRNNPDFAYNYIAKCNDYASNAYQKYLLYTLKGLYFKTKSDKVSELSYYFKALEIKQHEHFIDHFHRVELVLMDHYLHTRNYIQAKKMNDAFFNYCNTGEVKSAQLIDYFLTQKAFIRIHLYQDYKKADSILDKIITHSKPTTLNSSIYSQKFYSLYLQKRYQEIINLYSKTRLANSPHLIDIKNIIGKTYYKLGDFENAKHYLKDFLETESPKNDDYFDSYLMYSDILKREENIYNAYNILKEGYLKNQKTLKTRNDNSLLLLEIENSKKQEKIKYTTILTKWQILTIIIVSLFIFLLLVLWQRQKLMRKIILNKRMVELKNIQLKEVNENLEKFAQIASHDLKAPIRTIDQLTTFIEEDEKNLSDDTKENIKAIHNSTKGAQILIMNMLALAKMNDKNIKRRSCSLQNIFTIVEQNLYAEIHQASITIHYNNLDQKVHGNEQLLIQMFQNFIQNSIKYRKTEIPLVIHVYTKVCKGNTIVYIKDNGIGIKKEKLKTIFEAFSQDEFKSLEKGVGLGLFITRKIASYHNISITIDSKENDGTLIGVIFDKKKLKKRKEKKSSNKRSLLKPRTTSSFMPFPKIIPK
ncbi:histidine kinase [Flavobacteriaceae bacterium UJ101]|nr:histidine kinase [Flavobacteriaceae bacterium UJ101]